jgi:hypothetical protein
MSSTRNVRTNWLPNGCVVWSALLFATGVIATDAAAKGIPRRNPIQALIPTIDWYKEPPPKFGSTGFAEVYHELIVGVPAPLHGEAIALLGRADVVEITDSQSKHFGFHGEPSSILRSVVQENTKELHRYEKRIVELRKGDPNLSPAEIKSEVKSFEQLVLQARARIKEYERWQFRMKPYLVKSVALQNLHEPRRLQEPEHFSGNITPKGLVIIFGTVGKQPVKIIKMPVIAYLPYKPSNVYTELSMMD